MKRLVKIIKVMDDEIEFEKKVNEFNETHSVFATQTHVVPASRTESLNTCHQVYVAVIFYNEA